MESEVRRLRVLYLITELGKGGAERLLIDLATALRSRDDVDFNDRIALRSRPLRGADGRSADRATPLSDLLAPRP